MPSYNYHQIKAMNWSRIKHALDSGKHYLHHLGKPVKETDAMRLGTACHTLVLEPENAGSIVVCPPHLASETTGKMLTNKDVRAWLLGQPEGANVITPQQFDAARWMRDAVLEHVDAAYLLKTCTQRERVVQWKANDRDRKGSIDAFGARCLIDLKTDGEWGDTTTPHSFCNKADKLHYYGGLGNYAEGLEANGELVDEMGWIVVGSKAPYNVLVIMLDRDGMAHARDEAGEAWRRVVQWEASGVYTGTHPRKVLVGPPKWCGWKGKEAPVDFDEALEALEELNV